ncbi:class D sortase [Cohnella algarum]|uniref:class D sortase n=1 Tax=Cohnella algarum TaxID=2044859 RepID=UPI0019685449|nr:class D sortase [Cohnella algarum]MBN2982141.1 class D sortase [Cohnella algarum]
MKKLYLLFILAGVFLICYPHLNEWVQDRKQAQLLAAAERELAEADDRLSSSVSTLKNGLAKVNALLEQSAQEEEPEEPDPFAAYAEDERPLAILTIDKIDVKLPVLEGATKQNMKHAAAHMTETAALGEVGNAAVAAHRARTKGRLFNRLDEVEIGDKIDVKTSEGSYSYTVYEIKIVEPTELSVLEPNGTDRILTLITCDPLVNPTHRLIVHAKITDSAATAD